MMSFRWFFRSLLILGLFAATPALAAEQDAATYTNSIGQKALAILSAKDADAVKQTKLEQMFTEIVDTDWIGRFVIGSNWNKMKPDQQADYLSTYRRFLVKHYTSNFKEYSEGTTFKVMKSRPIGAKDQYLVSMSIKQADNPQPINMDYRLKQTGTEFKVIDIVVEGVSLLATQRSEFASVIQRGGVDKLMTLLKKKAA